MYCFRDKYDFTKCCNKLVCKPDNPDQLFFRDFFKLTENTELIVVSPLANEEDMIKIPVQFIKTYLYRNPVSPSRWHIAFRDQDGVEYMADIYEVGALFHEGIWSCNQWITLKETS
jgi:hypothetical protein